MTVALIDDARLAEVRARFDAIPHAEKGSLTGDVKALLARLTTAESERGELLREKERMGAALRMIGPLEASLLNLRVENMLDERDRSLGHIETMKDRLRSTQNIVKNLSEDGQHLSPAGERSATNV